MYADDVDLEMYADGSFKYLKSWQLYAKIRTLLQQRDSELAAKVEGMPEFESNSGLVSKEEVLALFTTK